MPLPEHVKVDVQRDAKRLVLDLPEGLLDVYLGDDQDSDDDDWEMPV